MAGNTFGHTFRLTSFGESHGFAVGGVIDGCPAGLEIDERFIEREMARRRPGYSPLDSPRKEEDKVEFLSGIFEGKSTGTPIAFIIKNKDQKSEDYNRIREIFRPSHADFTYEKKYGIRDYRGGGRASARETAVRVAGGAIAKLLLKHNGITVRAYVSAVGKYFLKKNYQQLDLGLTEQSAVRCPDKALSDKIIGTIELAKMEGDTLGGQVTCVIQHVPPGLGEPVFDKLESELARAMLSINAVKGFEIGSGFGAIQMKGSEHNDQFIQKSGAITTLTNFSGGVLGGISNGQDIVFNTAFKPVATIMQKQSTVNNNGQRVNLEPEGRHDVCVVPRAVPIVEGMAALVMADLLLRNKSVKINL